MAKNLEFELRALANSQGGYFTARQAEKIGYVRNHHSYHVSVGNWSREATGIFRLTGVPVINPAIEELHCWLLWTMGRKSDSVRGILSYETALIVHGLSDLVLGKVHISVPRNFRTSLVPKILVLHKEDRVDSEIVVRDGLKLIKPLIAIVDLLREARISIEHLETAFKQGIIKGVILISDIKKSKLSQEEQTLFSVWLKDIS